MHRTAHSRGRTDAPGPRGKAARGVGVVAGALLAGPAWAAATPLRPPTPGELAGAPTVTTILVTVVLVGLVLLAALLPTKRGHQD